VGKEARGLFVGCAAFVRRYWAGFPPGEQKREGSRGLRMRTLNVPVATLLEESVAMQVTCKKGAPRQGRR
jgi:hypothetical protein